MLVVWRKFKAALITVSPETAYKLFTRIFMKRKLNVKNPQTFNEKIVWLMLHTYRDNPLVTMCVDKYKVREYLKQKGCGEILNPMLGVWDLPEEIPWESLPQKFAMKCNHGCQYNIICTNKDKLDWREAYRSLYSWLKEDCWKVYGELNYKGIEKKIICEKYIETPNGVLPNDYKIYCFNGVPRLVLCCSERRTKLRLEWYDLDWKPLNIGAEINEMTAQKPVYLKQMIHYARILSRDFPYVRVDFYDGQNGPIFGEMTFTPAAGIARYYSKEGDIWLGSLLELPGGEAT